MAGKDALLHGIRASMAKHNLNAYIITSADPHQSEYTPPAFARVKAVTHFTGSAGTAVITPDKAFLWTDVRYWLQAVNEMSAAWELKKPIDQTLDAWLGALPKDSRVGIDPNVVSVSGCETFKNAVKLNKAEIVNLPDNLVDSSWEGRPDLPHSEVFLLKQQYTGKNAQTKLSDVRAALKEKKAQAVVFSRLDDIAHLYNIRGADVDCTPLVLSYAIVTLTASHLFCDMSRVPKAVQTELARHTAFHAYSDILGALSGQFGILKNTDRVLYDGSSTTYAVLAALKKFGVDSVASPSSVQISKAEKTGVEAKGFVNCHIRDGVALAKYLQWVEAEVQKGTVLNEYEASEKLLSFRKKQELFVGDSFPTISSSGPNGAVIHYRPAETGSRNLALDEIYLVDSGGQYFDGTTDVTRTVCFSTPKPKEILAYTLVLKGNLAIKNSIFPHGTKGNKLDGLARSALWQHGLDYGHGTGHGVGHFLGVHEGPIGIGGPRPGEVALAENNVISNEPGYYEDGSFGIRIENLELVVKAETAYRFKDVQYYTMQTLTMCPLDANLIDVALLSPEEADTVDAYHKDVLEKLSAADTEKDAGFLAWLKEKCKPLVREDAERPRKKQRTQ